MSMHKADDGLDLFTDEGEWFHEQVHGSGCTTSGYIDWMTTFVNIEGEGAQVQVHIEGAPWSRGKAPLDIGTNVLKREGGWPDLVNVEA